MNIIICPICGGRCNAIGAGWKCEVCGERYVARGEVTDMTNADRIRAMSDEELATMLFDYKECNKNCIMNSGKHCYEICEEESCILKWLQQSAEEDT